MVSISAGELMRRGMWEDVCDELGINPWAVNEGRMDSEDLVALTEEQATRVGLLSTCRIQR